MALYKCIILLSFLIPLTLSCLQCDTDLRTMLWQIEHFFIPAKISESCLKTRARIVVSSMSHGFFTDYAYNEYLGFIDVPEFENVANIAKKKLEALQKNPPAGKAFLDALIKHRAIFLRLLKKGLKKYKSKACSPKECGVFTQEALDCTRCTKVAPRCFTQDRCKVKNSKRARRGKSSKRNYEETRFFSADKRIFSGPDKNTQKEQEKKEEENHWFLIVALATVDIAGLMLFTWMAVGQNRRTSSILVKDYGDGMPSFKQDKSTMEKSGCMGTAKCRRFTKRVICKLNSNMAKKRKASANEYSAIV